MRRQLGGEALLQLVQVGAVRGGGERPQDGEDSVEQLSGALEGLDGVGDRGLGLVGGHGLPLGALDGHARAHGRLDVLVAHGGEVGQSEVERPWPGEDVGPGKRDRCDGSGLGHGPIVPCARGLLRTVSRGPWDVRSYQEGHRIPGRACCQPPGTR